MNIVIKSVDHAPDDLEAQTPIRGRLLRTIAGHNRSNCWLVELRPPVSWTTDGATRTIRHLVVWARWQGTSIGPGAALPVGIVRALARQVLLVFVIPALITDLDGRGMHDRATGTALSWAA